MTKTERAWAAQQPVLRAFADWLMEERGIGPQTTRQRVDVGVMRHDGNLGEPCGGGGAEPAVAGHDLEDLSDRADEEGLEHVELADVLDELQWRVRILARLILAVENIYRLDLTPLEEAAAVAQLREAHFTQEMIADRLGKSVRWVARRIRLDALSPDGGPSRCSAHSGRRRRGRSPYRCRA